MFNDAKARLQTSPAAVGALFPDETMQRRGRKPHQQEGKSRYRNRKAEKIFIDHHAENGVYHCVLYRCKALRQQ